MARNLYYSKKKKKINHIFYEDINNFPYTYICIETFVMLFKSTSQICENAFRILAYHHLLETFPESGSQFFLHSISDIRHLILVNVYIVRFDKFLKKDDKNFQYKMFSKCLKSTIYTYLQVIPDHLRRYRRYY